MSSTLARTRVGKLVKRTRGVILYRNGHIKKTSDTIFKWIKLAVEHQQNDRRDDAERLYRRVLRREPANSDALHYLGLLKFHRGDTEEAIGLIKRAVTI